jgi:hypothetical protein
MRTHKLKIEITTTTNMPLNLTEIQQSIMAVRKDAYVNVIVEE